MLHALSFFFGVLIGLPIGGLGGGGGVLILPLLIYGLGVVPKQAVVLSIVIVGMTSVYAAGMYIRKGLVRWPVVVCFSASGALGAYCGALCTQFASERTLLLTLFVVMIVVGSLMLRSGLRHEVGGARVLALNSRTVFFLLVCAGVVGFLTGFLGIGGGFLIVPCLVLIVRLPVLEAAGTSLCIMCVNALSSYFAHLGESIRLDIVLPFLLGSLISSSVAYRYAQRLPAATIKKAFAGFVLCLAGYVAFDVFVGSGVV